MLLRFRRLLESKGTKNGIVRLDDNTFAVCDYSIIKNQVSILSTSYSHVRRTAVQFKDRVQHVYVCDCNNDEMVTVRKRFESANVYTWDQMNKYER